VSRKIRRVFLGVVKEEAEEPQRSRLEAVHRIIETVATLTQHRRSSDISCSVFSSVQTTILFRIYSCSLQTARNLPRLFAANNLLLIILYHYDIIMKKNASNNVERRCPCSICLCVWFRKNLLAAQINFLLL